MSVCFRPMGRSSGLLPIMIKIHINMYIHIDYRNIAYLLKLFVDILNHLSTSKVIFIIAKVNKHFANVPIFL